MFSTFCGRKRDTCARDPEFGQTSGCQKRETEIGLTEKAYRRSSVAPATLTLLASARNLPARLCFNVASTAAKCSRCVGENVKHLIET